MNQSYKATLSQYALPQFLPTWGGKGGVIWGDLEGWSRDPMFEKYPSISPYTYCVNNPVILVDPTGEEIEFNGLIDIVYVFCESIFNKDFRNQVKELKKSEETYVFKFNNVAENNFTTDGEKLFINYSNIEKDSKTGKILEGSERL